MQRSRPMSKLMSRWLQMQMPGHEQYAQLFLRSEAAASTAGSTDQLTNRQKQLQNVEWTRSGWLADKGN